MTSDHTIVEERQNELHRLIKASEAKYTYYLLSIAAAAIAFAVHKTSGSALLWSQIPLGVAVILWGYSFFYGCGAAEYEIERLEINWKLLSLENLALIDFPSTDENRKIGKEKLREKAQDINRTKKKQFVFLVAGAGMFIFWHMIEMYILIPNP